MKKIELEIDPNFENVDSNIVKGLTIGVMRSEKIEEYEILMIFTDDDTLFKLKKEFFNKNQWTDVIAFRMNDYEEELVEGEIYISIPRAKENANKFNEPFAKEIGRLIIHGGLHLLNYDDETTVDKKVITGKEDEYLQHFKWENLIDE